MVHGRAFDLQHAAIALFSHHDELGGCLEAACGQVRQLGQQGRLRVLQGVGSLFSPPAMSSPSDERAPLGVCCGVAEGGAGVALDDHLS